MVSVPVALKGLGAGIAVPMLLVFIGSWKASAWLFLLGLFAPVFLIAAFVLLFAATYLREGSARGTIVLWATFTLGWPVGTWSAFAIYGSLAE